MTLVDVRVRAVRARAGWPLRVGQAVVAKQARGVAYDGERAPAFDLAYRVPPGTHGTVTRLSGQGPTDPDGAIEIVWHWIEPSAGGRRPREIVADTCWEYDSALGRVPLGVR